MKIIQPCLAKTMNTLLPEKAYAVLSKATMLEAQGKNIIHFEIGQPDFKTPDSIIKEAVKALNNGLTKYTPPLGIMPFRSKIAENLSKEFDTIISPKQIAITPSGKTAIFIAMASVIEKGDEVIYPDPGFPTYSILTDYLGAVKKPIPLVEENNFSFDMKILKKKFSKKTKLIILNSPSNPTGGIIPYKDLQAIADMVKGTNCWIMTDEIYTKIVYDNLKCPSIYSFKNLRNRTFFVDSFSKTYSMTGWRLGYISAPERIMEKVDYLITHTVGCTATFTQHAVLNGMDMARNDLKKMVKEFSLRRDFVVDRLNKIKGVSCKKPQGAFYAFPNIKSFKKKSEWMANYLLEKANVALLDGTAFGGYGEGYLRISYATSMKNLKEGLDRIEKALSKLK